MPLALPLKPAQAGFTLIELLVAMTVFSFMLGIVSIGFINIVHIRNQSEAANTAGDNARVGLDEVVRAIRNSNGVQQPVGPGVAVCLSNTLGGLPTIYYLSGGIMMRAVSPDCKISTASQTQAITSSIVTVTAFTAAMNTSGTTRQQVDISLTVASNNGTTNGVGSAVTCNQNNIDRNFCSTVTLTSGAVPR